MKINRVLDGIMAAEHKIRLTTHEFKQFLDKIKIMRKIAGEAKINDYH